MRARLLPARPRPRPDSRRKLAVLIVAGGKPAASGTEGDGLPLIHAESARSAASDSVNMELFSVILSGSMGCSMLSPRSQSKDPATGAARFGTTQWSVVLKAGQGAEEALVKLCKLYWPPLYAYTRRRGHAVHEAQDLTQAFFAHLLENRGLARVAYSGGQ